MKIKNEGEGWKWDGPLDADQMAERLGIACCALDKLASWTVADDKEFGDSRHFAKTAIDVAMRSTKAAPLDLPEKPLTPADG